MDCTLNRLKDQLGVLPEDLNEVRKFRLDRSEIVDRVRAPLTVWCIEKKLVEPGLEHGLIQAELYSVLLSAQLDHRFQLAVYRQVVHWNTLQLDETQVLLIFGRIAQQLNHEAVSHGSPSLQYGLMVIVDIARILALKILGLNRKLDSLRKHSKQEIARIQQTFSLLAANLPDDLLNAYISHQNWLCALIETLVNRVESKVTIPNSEQCYLTHWLSDSGMALLPAGRAHELVDAHERAHQIAEQLEDDFSKQLAYRMFSLLADLEANSAIVSAILLQCIDESLTRTAVYDPLTRLRNRSTLEPIFDRQLSLSKRLNRNLAAVMLDVDRFKAINDTYGHLFGDQVLSELARCFETHIRSEDSLFRWGGEEFLIIGMSEPSSGNDMAALAERLRKVVEETTFCLNTDTPVNFTVSAGVCEFNPRECRLTMSQVVEQADELLYQAKQNGRNRVESAVLNAPAPHQDKDQTCCDDLSGAPL